MNIKPLSQDEVDLEEGIVYLSKDQLDMLLHSPEKAGRKKPKTNRKGDKDKSMPMDRCQTQPTAVEPLHYLLDSNKPIIWESAEGEGNIVKFFRTNGYEVFGSDILDGTNFFTEVPNRNYDCIITNPPYSIKYDWIKRCYELGKPFALLVPVDTLAAGKAQIHWEKYGIPQIIFFRGRNNFSMPNKGLEGKGAQFSTIWYTHGFNFPQNVYVWDLKEGRFRV